MECYSTLKKKGILTGATTLMKLEDIILSKISKSQKDKYCLTSLYELPIVVQFIETENSMMIVRGCRNDE